MNREVIEDILENDQYAEIARSEFDCEQTAKDYAETYGFKIVKGTIMGTPVYIFTKK